MCAQAAQGPTAGLAVAVTRLAGALRRLDLGRLSRPPRLAPKDGSSLDEGGSVADRAYLLSCALAALPARCGGAGAPPGSGGGESTRRPPRLGDHAAADQRAVVGRDAVAALHGSGEASATADVVAQVVALTEQLRELRLQL